LLANTLVVIASDLAFSRERSVAGGNPFITHQLVSKSKTGLPRRAKWRSSQ
jgi:hypothetical protein